MLLAQGDVVAGAGGAALTRFGAARRRLPPDGQRPGLRDGTVIPVGALDDHTALRVREPVAPFVAVAAQDNGAAVRLDEGETARTRRNGRQAQRRQQQQQGKE